MLVTDVNKKALSVNQGIGVFPHIYLKDNMSPKKLLLYTTIFQQQACLERNKMGL